MVFLWYTRALESFLRPTGARRGVMRRFRRVVPFFPRPSSSRRGAGGWNRFSHPHAPKVPAARVANLPLVQMVRGPSPIRVRNYSALGARICLGHGINCAQEPIHGRASPHPAGRLRHRRRVLGL